MNQFSVLYMFDAQKVKHFTGSLVMHDHFRIGTNNKMLDFEQEQAEIFVDLFEQTYKLNLNLKR